MANPNNQANGNGSNGHSGTEPPRVGDLTQLVRHTAQDARRVKLVSLQLIEGAIPATLAVPAGYELKDVMPMLDKFRTAPRQRAGTTVLRDLASFIAWTNRHKDQNSVVYALDDMSSPSLTAIIDHDQAGPDEVDKIARFGRHRGCYTFPLSREWQEWTGASEKPMKPGEFAAFIERRIGDVVPPPYSVDGTTGEDVFNSQDPEIRKLVVTLGKKLASVADLVKLAEGIEINVDSKAAARINRDTGEHYVEFSEANGQGTDRIKPPNAFLIAIPVLHNGPAVLIAVHLRYRAIGGTVHWIVELHQPERVFEEVFKAALNDVFTDTGLQPLRGVAPAAR